MFTIKKFTSLALILALNSCISKTITSGHTEVLENDIFTTLEQKKAKEGLTKENLLLELGSPEVISNIDGEKWFYLSNISKRRSFLKPLIKHNYIIVVSFDNDKVRNIRRIEEANPKNLSFASGKTPAKGDDSNIYKEIFGNIGRFNVNRNTSLK